MKANTVINSYGVEVDFRAATAHMDDEIREGVHADLCPCTDQEFFNEYARRHAIKYGEDDWQPAQANPIW